MDGAKIEPVSLPGAPLVYLEFPMAAKCGRALEARVSSTRERPRFLLPGLAA
jgi:hypothetical protein